MGSKAMPAPKGNDYNKKWPTSEERQEVCRELCDHLSQGLSLACFPPCDPKTLRRYVEEYPEDFPPEQIEQAFRKGRLEWETIGKNGAKGELQGFNNGSWVFNMKNRYGWKDMREFEGLSILPQDKPQATTAEVTRPVSAAELGLGVMALLSELEPEEDANTA